jgi:hypothetical protein
MRRKQRIIPVLQKPKNDSLDFVQTIGRLYYDGKDHKDLAQKMGAHFLDHVRTRYKISTNVLDGAFINALREKSGYPVAKLTELVDFIDVSGGDPHVSEKQLATFHKELEKFYQQT